MKTAEKKVRTKNTCPVKYKLEHARHLIDAKIEEIIPEPKRVATFESLTIGSRLILFRDYRNPRNSELIRIARSPHEPLAYLAEKEASYSLPLLNERNFLYAIVSKIDRVKQGFTAKIYVPEIIPIKNLRRLTFILEDNPNHFFPKKDIYVLDMKERRLTYEERGQYTAHFHYELAFSHREWRNTVEMIQFANFLAWENSYLEVENDFCQWTVTLEFSRGKKFQSIGSRIHPEELTIFRNYLDSCFDIRNQKGNGVFQIIDLDL